jgi:hypothetical protein
MSRDEKVLTQDTETQEVGSAFDPANFNTVLLIMLQRLYDVNMAFLMTVNPQKAQELYSLHESGDYLAPPPSILVD